MAPSGSLTLDDGTTFDYTYDPLDTFNVYSIQLFTKPTEYVFAEGGNSTTDFQKFVDFYGELHVKVYGYDQWMYQSKKLLHSCCPLALFSLLGSDTYADDIIQAALAGTSTSFSTGKDVDASGLDETGRAGKLT